jgi:DNA repair protein RecN (Recombination protein N)
MLKELHIRNFALIESLDLNFSNGFTVFTGETGSGKSIILGALNLIRGERADYSVIRDESQKTSVEAVFEIEGLNLESFFQQNDLDFQNETIIRREIASNGKSRAFVNDTPVSLTILNDLTFHLIKIHSQFHTYALKSKKFQLELIDGLAGISLANYQGKYKEWKALNVTITSLEKALHQAAKDADYINFQLTELNELQLDSLNYSDLEQKLTQLENAKEIIHYFSLVDHAVENENGVLSPLNSLASQLQRGSSLHPKLAEIQQRVQGVIAEIKDIHEESVDALDTVSIDEEKQVELAQKLDVYNRQLKKHQAINQEELMRVLAEFSLQNSSTEEMQKAVEEAKEKYKKLTLELEQLAQEIHLQREQVRSTIELQIAELLDKLKLVGARMVVELTKLTTLNEFGCTEIELLFTSNKGSEPKAIEKAASGGELSRLMLSIERLLSAKKNLPTLLLDEIDTGVSGEVALKMGQMLGEMGQNMQLFSITHLPQVAARGQHHFKVFKKESNNVTKTFVTNLTHEERLVEIASLMSGENVSEVAIENAKLLMK